MTLATCPNGHASTTADYCDACGAKIDDSIRAGPGAPLQATEILPAMTTLVDRSAPADPCPVCNSPRAVADRYCENCGHDYSRAGEGSSRASVDAAWEIVITADRERLDRLDQELEFEFPVDPEPRTLRLELPELRIGRGDRGGATPEIDLGGAGGDPAVSRAHALFVRGNDGAYTITDQGSTNGTRLNDDPMPLAAGLAVLLSAGDRVHVGAWTTITIRRASG